MRPIVAGVDLPARAIGDHRRLYLEYEGEISGNRGRVRRLDEGTYRVLLWSAEHIRVELAGSQLVGEVELRRDSFGFGRCDILELSDGKLGLKHLPRGKDGSLESPLGSIGTSRQSDLAGTDLEFLELHVLALDVRRIPHDDDRITILASPLDVNAMEPRVLDDPVDHIVGWYGQDARAGFSPGSTRPCSPRERGDEPRP